MRLILQPLRRPFDRATAVIISKSLL